MNVKKISIILGAIAAAFCIGYFNIDRIAKEVASADTVQVVSKDDAAARLKEIQAREEADMKLGQYAINMMYRTPAAKRLSDAKKQILARAIVRVTNDVFATEDHRKAFIMVLAIESGFERTAQSPTGPKGLAQVARTAFHEGLKNCGLPEAGNDDVWETDLNLYAGACYFRALLEANGGDPFVAVVAYNQGPNSDAAKTYAKSGYMENVEALKYVARFGYLQRTVPTEKAPGVPSIDELPKVSKPSAKSSK